MSHHGVAKTRYRQATHPIELCRGTSHRPLFITSIGIPYDLAAERIASMPGSLRIPTLLKAADCLARFAP